MRTGRQPQTLQDDTPEPAEEEAHTIESDAQFLTAWQAELMSRTWEGLTLLERTSGQPLHAILRYRTDHTNARSEQMAKYFSVHLGKSVDANWVRKRLCVAREKFTDLLLEELARSLEQPSLEELEDELTELELLDYCKGALERRRDGP